MYKSDIFFDGNNEVLCDYVCGIWFIMCIDVMNIYVMCSWGFLVKYKVLLNMCSNMVMFEILFWEKSIDFKRYRIIV